MNGNRKPIIARKYAEKMLGCASDALDTIPRHNYLYYYNHERIKLGLKGVSPVEYRLRNTARSAGS